MLILPGYDLNIHSEPAQNLLTEKTAAHLLKDFVFFTTESTFFAYFSKSWNTNLMNVFRQTATTLCSIPHCLSGKHGKCMKCKWYNSAESHYPPDGRVVQKDILSTHLFNLPAFALSVNLEIP